MEKFIPYEKLSKKKQRELNKEKRGSWGALNPVTRKSENPKAYNRKKARQWSCEDRHDVPVFVRCREKSLEGIAFRSHPGQKQSV